MSIDITLNRYLDHDPHGRMYVLERDLTRVRSEEATNARARSGAGEPAVSIGLQSDAIQPLTMRVHQGECLVVDVRNALPQGEKASIHLHGAGLRVAGGGPAIATNPEAMAASGHTVSYHWMVGRDEPEGTRYFHSHGNDRLQTNHGLFGAVIVETAGSSWLDPSTGRDDGGTGWEAIVQPSTGRAFREFALYYHEIGDENYQPLDRNGMFVPLVDPITHAYRPDSRDLNYRSEPFMNRLLLQQRAGAPTDQSLEYSSYSFGDPATPIMRSYLGDPIKQRVVHAGSEVLHVHHVHGGGTRWLRQPGTEPPAQPGLNKHPPLHPRSSERTDSQTLGPSETFDVEAECGSGGCQQSAGDFMYHCHVTEHYFAGMWGIWRVYNTLQDGGAHTDQLARLGELPDRSRSVQAAVTSDALAGLTVSSFGRAATIGAGDLAAWVGLQLPPPGIARGYDASVLDWQQQGPVAVGEPEAATSWPGYAPAAPGTRPPLLFDPATGRLAYPFLKPHLGKRPPFAPGHGPAPFLDPVAPADALPAPGANGPGSVCPEGTQLEQLNLNAIRLPVTLSTRANLVDPSGELFVLRQQEDAVRADGRLREPLTVRANAGQQCVDVLLRSELADNGDIPFSKVSTHIHFAQFDVQASDGVDTGFNYEQTVRPFRAEGETLTSPVAGGATQIRSTNPARFQAGALVGVGVDQDATFETRTIASVSGDTITLRSALGHAHAAGEVLSTEFVRYRWYPDVQFGTAFFHDHTNVLDSGRHGLFGALVSEPPDSTYHDPHSGAPIQSGAIADIHTAGQISTDVRGSFRELMLFLQDDNPITHIGRSTGSSINLRADPPEQRARDPSQLFSSYGVGDPETPLLEAYAGDPLAIRTLVAASNDVHTLHVDGHWFRAEPWSPTSPPIDTIDVGISERYDLVIPRAGGPQAMPGDYLYYSGRTANLREGSWGILRVDDRGGGSGIQPLPGHQPALSSARSSCPADSPRREFAIAAVMAPLPMLGGRPGKIFALQSDRHALTTAATSPEPLALHVNVGDCLAVTLTNATREGPVSFHADMLAADPRTSAGVTAGLDPDQSVAPGRSHTYTLYADPSVGETVALVRDWGNVLDNPGRGLYGAIIVGPAGARYTDPVSGADMAGRAGWSVDVHPASGSAYRDAALFFQDADAGIGTHRMPYTEHVEGVVGLNYRAEPLKDRLARVPDPGEVFRSDVHGDPATPLIRANPGDLVKIHVLAPWSAQEQVFSVEGHSWEREPGRAGTNVVSSQSFGGLDAKTLALRAQQPGDYLYGDHRQPYSEAGLWGILRVQRCGGEQQGIIPLDGGCAAAGSSRWAVVIALVVLIPLAAVPILAAHRRKKGYPC